MLICVSQANVYLSVAMHPVRVELGSAQLRKGRLSSGGRAVVLRDAPNFRPPKISGRKWPKSAFSVFGQNTFITETTRPKQKFVMTQTKSAASTRLSG